MNMDTHDQACHSNNKSNGIHINDNYEDVAGISDQASWKSGRKCSFGCQGLWHNPESFDAHKKDYCHNHMDYLNKRVVRLEKSNESRMNKEYGDNDINVLMVGLQQQPSGGPVKNDSEMEHMEKIRSGMSREMNEQQIEFLHQHSVNGAAVNTSFSSAGASKSNNNHKNSARLDLEVHRLSTRMQTLESQQQFIVRSDSTPLSNATSLSSPPTAVAVTSREDVSGVAMKKLELCFRKAEAYEGMAMVLNTSLDRLLTQVTEIDNQRRRESELRESQERKIQVSVVIEVRQRVGYVQRFINKPDRAIMRLDCVYVCIEHVT